MFLYKIITNKILMFQYITNLPMLTILKVRFKPAATKFCIAEFDIFVLSP